MAELPLDRFNRIIKENNLKITAKPFIVREINDGGVIIEKPHYDVDWEDPKKEIKKS